MAETAYTISSVTLPGGTSGAFGPGWRTGVSLPDGRVFVFGSGDSLFSWVNFGMIVNPDDTTDSFATTTGLSGPYANRRSWEEAILHSDGYIYSITSEINASGPYPPYLQQTDPAAGTSSAVELPGSADFPPTPPDDESFAGAYRNIVSLPNGNICAQTAVQYVDGFTNTGYETFLAEIVPTTGATTMHPITYPTDFDDAGPMWVSGGQLHIARYNYKDESTDVAVVVDLSSWAIVDSYQIGPSGGTVDAGRMHRAITTPTGNIVIPVPDSLNQIAELIDPSAQAVLAVASIAARSGGTFADALAFGVAENNVLYGPQSDYDIDRWDLATPGTAPTTWTWSGTAWTGSGRGFQSVGNNKLVFPLGSGNILIVTQDPPVTALGGIFVDGAIHI